MRLPERLEIGPNQIAENPAAVAALPIPATSGLPIKQHGTTRRSEET
jgi:hypothetical protein